VLEKNARTNASDASTEQFESKRGIKGDTRLKVLPKQPEVIGMGRNVSHS